MAANSGPTSSGAMTNFKVALTSSLIKLVNATIKFFGSRTRSRSDFAPVLGYLGKLRSNVQYSVYDYIKNKVPYIPLYNKNIVS